MKYGIITDVYQNEITLQKQLQDPNKDFLESRNIKTNWEYRDFLRHKVELKSHTNQVNDIQHNQLYHRLEEQNRHNRSDLKKAYINNMKNTFYKIAPAIHNAK